MSVLSCLEKNTKGQLTVTMNSDAHNVGLVTTHQLSTHSSVLWMYVVSCLEKNTKAQPDSYHELGGTQYELRDFTSALHSHQRALDAHLKLFGEEHKRAAHGYQELGCAQCMLGDFTSALHSLQRAWDVRRKLLGENHASTVESYLLLKKTELKLCEGQNV